MNFTKMCRTCLEVVTEPVSVTSNIYEFMEKDMGLNIRLANCPLCLECYRSLLSIKKFYTQCHDAEEFLKMNLKSKPKTMQENAAENQEDMDEEGTNSEEMYATDQETYEDEICKTDTLENEQILLSDNTDTLEIEQILLSDNNYLEYDEDICNFSQKDSLPVKKSTKKIRAEDKKKYTCDTCGKTFVNCWVLRNHKYIHSNHKPFKCNICQQSFRQKGTLRTHEALHSGKTIKCDKCIKSFARKWQLMRHIRVHLKQGRGEKN